MGSIRVNDAMKLFIFRADAYKAGELRVQVHHDYRFFCKTSGCNEKGIREDSKADCNAFKSS